MYIVVRKDVLNNTSKKVSHGYTTMERARRYCNYLISQNPFIVHAVEKAK